MSNVVRLEDRRRETPLPLQPGEMTVQDAARMVQMSVRFVQSAISDGELAARTEPALRQAYAIHEDDLREWVERDPVVPRFPA